MSGIHFHLFAASLIAVASFTQAQEMLIAGRYSSRRRRASGG